MQIETQLSNIRLCRMAHSWEALNETRVHELSIYEGLKLLLQAEEDER